MSIISKTVEVILSGRMISYYENKGYKIPRALDQRGRMKVKRGTSITVNVNDLPKYSEVSIKIKCDKCGKIYYTSYSTYNNNMKKDNKKTYCQKCAVLIYNTGDNSYWKNKSFSYNHKEKISKAKIGKLKGCKNPN